VFRDSSIWNHCQWQSHSSSWQQASPQQHYGVHEVASDLKEEEDDGGGWWMDVSEEEDFRPAKKRRRVHGKRSADDTEEDEWNPASEHASSPASQQASSQAASPEPVQRQSLQASPQQASSPASQQASSQAASPEPVQRQSLQASPSANTPQYTCQTPTSQTTCWKRCLPQSLTPEIQTMTLLQRVTAHLRRTVTNQLHSGHQPPLA